MQEGNAIKQEKNAMGFAQIDEQEGYIQIIRTDSAK
jgi:hypothetical protein